MQSSKAVVKERSGERRHMKWKLSFREDVMEKDVVEV